MSFSTISTGKILVKSGLELTKIPFLALKCDREGALAELSGVLVMLYYLDEKYMSKFTLKTSSSFTFII